MKKLFYFLAVLVIAACSSNEAVEEPKGSFRSLEEFSAFIQEALSKANAPQTRSGDTTFVSATERIKQFARAKGIKFGIINEGTKEERVFFQGTSSDLQYRYANFIFDLLRSDDWDSPIYITVVVPFSYDIGTGAIYYDTQSQITMQEHVPRDAHNELDHISTLLYGSRGIVEDSINGYWIGSVFLKGAPQPYEIPYYRSQNLHVP